MKFFVDTSEWKRESCLGEVCDSMSGNECADSLQENTCSVGFLTVNDCGIVEKKQGIYIYVILMYNSK